MPINMALIWCIDMQSVHHPHGHILWIFSFVPQRTSSRSRQTDISHLLSGGGGLGKRVRFSSKIWFKAIKFELLNWKKLLFKCKTESLEKGYRWKSVSSSLSNFWSPLKWRGRQRKRERACEWGFVGGRTLHPAFWAPSLHSRRRRSQTAYFEPGRSKS